MMDRRGYVSFALEQSGELPDRPSTRCDLPLRIRRKDYIIPASTTQAVFSMNSPLESYDTIRHAYLQQSLLKT